MEFYSFARRNEKFLWVIGISVFILILSTFSWHSIYEFLKKNPTLIFLSVTALIAYKSYSGQRHLTVAKNTIDFQTAFHNSEDLCKATKIFRTKLRKMNADEIASLADEDRSQEKNTWAARELLNSWERVAVAVRNKVYDEEMLYNTYASFLLTIWTDLKPYVTKKQEDNPKFFVQVQWLAIRWQVRKEDKMAKSKLRKMKRKIAQLEDEMDV